MKDNGRGKWKKASVKNNEGGDEEKRKRNNREMKCKQHKHEYNIPFYYLLGFVGLPRLLFRRYRASDAEEMRQNHEVNHPPPSSGEVENEWSYTSTPAVCLSGVDKDKFTFCTFHSVTVA